MDVCKIAPGIYQYTAIDDCSRFKVLQLFPRRTSANNIKFHDTVLEQMPFAIQRIQTDRGKEVFVYSVQDKLMEWALNFGSSNPGLRTLMERLKEHNEPILTNFILQLISKIPTCQLCYHNGNFIIIGLDLTVL